MSAEFSQEDLSLSKAATLSARSFMLVPSRLIASSGPILQSSHPASSVKLSQSCSLLAAKIEEWLPGSP